MREVDVEPRAGRIESDQQEGEGERDQKQDDAEHLSNDAHDIGRNERPLRPARRAVRVLVEQQIEDEPHAEDDRDRNCQNMPARTDGDAAGTALRGQAEEEEAERAGDQCGDGRVLERGYGRRVAASCQRRAAVLRAAASRQSSTSRCSPSALWVGGAAGRAGVRHDQTFSTSGRPSSPEGRKISTMARMEKAATSLYSSVK